MKSASSTYCRYHGMYMSTGYLCRWSDASFRMTGGVNQMCRSYICGSKGYEVLQLSSSAETAGELCILNCHLKPLEHVTQHRNVALWRRCPRFEFASTFFGQNLIPESGPVLTRRLLSNNVLFHNYKKEVRHRGRIYLSLRISIQLFSPMSAMFFKLHNK
jgi:hypothetical protein